MPFSVRSDLDREPNRLSAALRRIQQNGKEILDLTLSNPTRAGIAYPGEAIGRALAHPRVLDYQPDPRGAHAARLAICADWSEVGVDLEPERVFLTASTSEAYGHLFKLLCDPGDELLILAPSYPLFEHLARFEGVTPVGVPLAFDGSWHLDFPRIRERIGPRTRAIAIVNPNNPTGSFVKWGELQELASLGLPLISDEVFARYPVHAPRDSARSALGTPGVLVFALSGLSKLVGLPQLKLSWITLSGPVEQVREGVARLELISDAYLSPSAPVMLALPELLSLCRPVRAQIQERIERNARALRDELHNTPITPRPVEGGWTAVLRLPNTRAEENWALEFLSGYDLLVQPGYFFDFVDGPYAVVSLLTPEREFSEGLSRIARCVSNS